MSPLGAVTYVSPAVEMLRGITPEQAMQQSIDETLTPESRDTVLQYFAEVGQPFSRAKRHLSSGVIWNTGETMVPASGPRCWLFR